MTKGEKLYTCVSRCVDVHAATKHREQMTKGEKLHTCVSRCVDIHAATKHRV